MSILTGKFLVQKYPMHHIKSAISKASVLNRNDLLNYKAKLSNKRIPMVFSFHPSIDKLAHSLKTDFKTYLQSNSLRDIFADPPLSARRQPPNLKSLITSSSLPQPYHSGNTKCQKPRCQICNSIITAATFKIPGTDHVLKPPPLTCDSSNLIYLLTCSQCQQGNYIGETGSKFRHRFNNHKMSIRHNFPGYSVGNHFNSPNHSINNLNCILLSNNHPSTEIRRKSELKLIYKYNTHKSGLNTDIGLLSNYSFFKE